MLCPIHTADANELSCDGGVYAPVGCRDPVYNSAAYEVGLEVWHDTSRMTLLSANLYLYVNSCSPEGATKLSTFSAL